MSKHIELGTGKFWFHCGYSVQIGLGFNVNRYGLNIDLGPFYIGVEW